MKVPYEDTSILNVDSLMELDRRLSYLAEVDGLDVRKPAEEKGSTPFNNVDNLLEKMDRFGDCEKILDRDLFQEEYSREISKSKRSKVRK